MNVCVCWNNFFEAAHMRSVFNTQKEAKEEEAKWNEAKNEWLNANGYTQESRRTKKWRSSGSRRRRRRRNNRDEHTTKNMKKAGRDDQMDEKSNDDDDADHDYSWLRMASEQIEWRKCDNKQKSRVKEEEEGGELSGLKTWLWNWKNYDDNEKEEKRQEKKKKNIANQQNCCGCQVKQKLISKRFRNQHGKLRSEHINEIKEQAENKPRCWQSNCIIRSLNGPN